MIIITYNLASVFIIQPGQVVHTAKVQWTFERVSAVERTRSFLGRAGQLVRQEKLQVGVCGAFSLLRFFGQAKK